ncbi:adenosine deaminase-like protein [Lucilia cuprina]|uniref:adenosine deaminase-like protein n=1 Tax=Lucilia cuprina TaxID=7375 RepID=UPI001F0525DA|nr:adenosine deaminase-like protein [Lucilia cuprina]
MDSFLRKLPKIELHAHLNGSLNTQSIKELGLQLYGENSEEFLRLCEKFTEFNNTDLDYCFQKFAFMHELTATKKGLKLACEMVIRDFALDNVIYLELRTTPKVNEQMTRRQYIQLIIEAIQECNVKYNIMVKLLLSVDRAQTLQSAEEIVLLAQQFKESHPDIVKGMDLSGNPNKGKFNDFIPVLNKAKQSKLNLALHCAEVSNPQEIQEMLDFGFERCGHGTFLSPQQLEQCLKRNITIECCLTSNVKCGTVSSYDSHHFRHVFLKNIKAVLCTDDSGVFDTSLTQEFKLACKYYELNMYDIKILTLNAIEACFASSEEKSVLRQQVEKYFKETNENF